MSTVELTSDSKLLRYYVKTWHASRNDINFCKMFWGILLSPLRWLLTIVLSPIWFPMLKLFDWLEMKHLENFKVKMKKDDERYAYFRKHGHWPQQDPTWINKVLQKIGNFFDHIGMFLNGHKKFFEWTFYVALGMLAAACVIGLIIFAINKPLIVLITVVGSVLVVGFIALLVILADRGYLQKSVAPVVWFFRFMWKGFKAFKSATCPTIVVK